MNKFFAKTPEEQIKFEKRRRKARERYLKKKLDDGKNEKIGRWF